MTKQMRADISLLAITVVWGSSFTLMKNVLDHMPPFAYLSLRFIVAAVALAVIFYKKLKHVNRKTVYFGCIIGLVIFGGMALQVYGLRYTTASNSAFITGTNVIMVPVISAMFLRKKPDLNSVIGVILTFAGLFFLTGGMEFSFNFGDFLTLMCAVCFALQIILIDKYTRNEDAVLISLIQIAFAALLYSGVWLGTDFQPVEINLPVIATLFITGVLGTAFAYAVQNVVQKDTSPTHTALIFTAEPVFGAVFALLIPNSAGVTETLKFNTVIGCALILLGMLACEVKIGNKEAVSQNQQNEYQQNGG
jgi:drug/metabolite transporter (DMT)-like permease